MSNHDLYSDRFMNTPVSQLSDKQVAYINGPSREDKTCKLSSPVTRKQQE